MLLNEDYFKDIELTDDDLESSDDIITAEKTYNTPE